MTDAWPVSARLVVDHELCCMASTWPVGISRLRGIYDLPVVYIWAGASAQTPSRSGVVSSLLSAGGMMPDTPPLPTEVFAGVGSVSANLDRFSALCDELFNGGDTAEQVAILNECRRILHKHSPFQAEPVDLVWWKPVDEVYANDYNPNAVAPPEMQLLELSILEDGFTQPIVGWDTGKGVEVIDGFHRNRVSRESEAIRERLHGYLPLTIANIDRLDRGDRIAATIRHNRARGKHQIGAMADIILELSRRNWSDKKIAKHLGMEPDEVLRLSQIVGLAEMFADRDFSEAWEATAISEVDDLEVEYEDA